MPQMQFALNTNSRQWLETPDEPASFGLMMFDGPELTGDHEQGIEITRDEYDALKAHLATLRARGLASRKPANRAVAA
jgi:hypothetical protein